MADTNPCRKPHPPGQGARGAMLLHAVCCGIPILVLAVASAGVTLEGIRRALPYLWAIGGAVLLAAWIWIFRQWRRRRSLACRHCAVDPAARGSQDHGHTASASPTDRGAGSSARSAYVTPSAGGEDRGRDR